MTKVLITGAKGTIGDILRKYLQVDYQLTLLDKVKSDEYNYVQMDLSKDYEGFRTIVKGHDVLIHLAWDVRENFRSNITVPENRMMIENVYKAALSTEPHPKVIMASSIHAAGIDWNKHPYCFIADRDFDNLKEKIPLMGENEQVPDSPYGRTKLWMEELGRRYSKQGLNVIIIRFGGINSEDTPLIDERGYNSIWLSHRDCSQLIRKCIEVKDLPSFVIFYGISNNRYVIYDISNARKLLDYTPKDDAETYFKMK